MLDWIAIIVGTMTVAGSYGPGEVGKSSHLDSQAQSWES